MMKWLGHPLDLFWARSRLVQFAARELSAPLIVTILYPDRSFHRYKADLELVLPPEPTNRRQGIASDREIAARVKVADRRHDRPREVISVARHGRYRVLTWVFEQTPARALRRGLQ